MDAPRVYVVSDVRLYREGLNASLAGQVEVQVLGAGSCDDVLDEIGVLRPDVMLLDLASRDSLSLPRKARLILPALLAIAYAVAEVERDVLACAQAGIAGYVPQHGSIEDLVAAVQGAVRGELICSPRISALLFKRIASLSSDQERVSGQAPLTSRERQIAALLARGLPNKEIARRLRLGNATIKNHVHNILQKLNLQRRGEIAPLLTGAAISHQEPSDARSSEQVQ